MRHPLPIQIVLAQPWTNQTFDRRQGPGEWECRRVGMHLKTSTQWDLVGISAALLTFASFFVFMFYGSLQGANSLLIGFGNPILMIFYLLISLVSFIYGYLHREKDETGSREEVDVVFINISRW